MSIQSYFHEAMRRVADAEAKSFSDFSTTLEGRCRDRLLDISREIMLLGEIKDIRDELQTILGILEDQKKALVRLPTQSWGDFYDLVLETIENFERMLKNSKDIYDALNHSLGLKHKQANREEAQHARENHEAADRQFNISMFFTLVTIYFGSLSIITSFFDLNVNVFPAGTWNISHLVGLIIGLSIAISTPFFIVAYLINPIKESWLFRSPRSGGGGGD